MAQSYISVSEFSNYVKSIFDNEEMLHGITILGEVSSFNVSNNIAYFTLKDSESMLSCVMFGANNFAPLNIGDMILVTGSPNYYTRGGRFSFNVIAYVPYGKGFLYEQFLKLKARLEELGYFDSSIKKPIPTNIRRVGVVTSRTGAVIQDIINVTRRRNDTIDIVLYPVKVQGIGAEQEIVEGINYFSKTKNVDCVIVARGGGSMEDLQPFNTMEVAEAVHCCELPIISAVGHETDFTICDFVSDLRVPTPSVAAETISWQKSEVISSVQAISDYLYTILIDKFSDVEQEVRVVTKNAMQNLNFGLQNVQSRVFGAMKSTNLLINNVIDRSISKVESLRDLILTYDPNRFIKLGYSKVFADGHAVTSVENLTVGQNLSCEFRDGVVYSNILEIKNDN